jgi:hypothetical protein
MSLDWDTTACDEPTPKTDEERDLRTALIWGSMAIGLGSITKANVNEWVWRLWHQRSTIDHIHLGEDATPEMVKEWVERWIGLTTNAPTMSRPRWLNRVKDIMAERTDRALRCIETESV